MDILRDIIEDLKRWKDSANRKPILLKGARQIGKTWVMQQFGKQCYEHCVRFDFDRQEELKTIFSASKEPKRIIRELSVYSDVPLLPGKTLIIFDEIQQCEEALNSLKYFCEDAPEYHIIAAGSLLGVAVKHRRMTVPVGKVKIMRMFPVSFKEFLRCDDNSIYQYIDSLQQPEHLPEIILNKLKISYRRYLVCGGMPDAAVAMLENSGMQTVDDILQGILDLYELDFAKYAAPLEIPRIHSVWHSLPSQLAKENRKFFYKILKTGARAKDYEDAIMWLEDAGMIYKINNISKPGMPLKAYEEPNIFKLYACDCGLLRRLANLPGSVIADPIANYTEFKGAMAENAVLQSIAPMLSPALPNYWSPGTMAELEFVIQLNDKIVPVEVKAENAISGRSLGVYNEKFKPEMRIRFSMLNLQMNGGLLSCPAPLAEWAAKWC